MLIRRNLLALKMASYMEKWRDDLLKIDDVTKTNLSEHFFTSKAYEDFVMCIRCVCPSGAVRPR